MLLVLSSVPSAQKWSLAIQSPFLVELGVAPQSSTQCPTPPRPLYQTQTSSGVKISTEFLFRGLRYEESHISAVRSRDAHRRG